MIEGRIQYTAKRVDSKRICDLTGSTALVTVVVLKRRNARRSRERVTVTFQYLINPKNSRF